jgi:cysteine-rich repeat protein
MRSSLLQFLAVCLVLVPIESVASVTCAVTFYCQDEVDIRSVSWEVDYHGISGGFFDGTDTNVHCAKFDQNLVYHFDDHDAAGYLSAAVISPIGGPVIFAPINLTTCTFQALVQPTIKEFSISVDDATDIDRNELLPLPSVGISSIQCAEASPCGNGAIDPGEECDDGDTTFSPGNYCTANCFRVPCGDPTQPNGTNPKASDALFVLRAAVNVGPGQCDPRVCDVNDSNFVTAADALTILKVSVGDSIPLACPLTIACPLNGPLTDLRQRCSKAEYYYYYGQTQEGFVTTGTTIAVSQTDGVDVLAYGGTITGESTFTLDEFSVDSGPLYPLDPGSSGQIDATGKSLNLTIRVNGSTNEFYGASFSSVRRF